MNKIVTCNFIETFIQNKKNKNIVAFQDMKIFFGQFAQCVSKVIIDQRNWIFHRIYSHHLLGAAVEVVLWLFSTEKPLRCKKLVFEHSSRHILCMQVTFFKFCCSLMPSSKNKRALVCSHSTAETNLSNPIKGCWTIEARTHHCQKSLGYFTRWHQITQSDQNWWHLGLSNH